MAAAIQLTLAMSGERCNALRLLHPTSLILPASAVDQRRIPRMDFLRLLAEPGNAQAHHVARLQVNRGWLAAHAHARRGPGADQVARVQRHEPADVADQLRDAEDHGP